MRYYSLVLLFVFCTSAFAQTPFIRHKINFHIDQPMDLMVLDLNNDSLMDIVSAASGNNSVSVFQQEGSSFFKYNAISASIAQANSVCAVDIDQDNDQDIISSSLQDNMIYWHKNDGSGNFTVTTLASNTFSVSKIKSLDVDNDSDIDLIAISSLDELVLFTNDGNQVFTQSVLYNQSAGLNDIFLVDIDTDSDIDILTTSFTDGTLNLLKNNGAGVFITEMIDSTLQGPTTVFAIDYDHDADQDILTTSYSDSTIIWYKNNLGSFTDSLLYEGIPNPIHLRVADLDNDSLLDIVVSDDINGKIYRLEDNGMDSIVKYPVLSRMVGCQDIILQDMNADGLVDITACSKRDSKITIGYADSLTNFRAVNISYGTSRPFILASDMDADDDIDIVCVDRNLSNLSLKNLSLFENDGQLNVVNKYISTGKYDTGSPHWKPLLIETDSSGFKDIAIANGRFYHEWFKHTGNNNSFDSIRFQNPNFSVHDSYGYRLYDFDNDSDMDIVLWGYKKVEVFLNNYNGTFTHKGSQYGGLSHVDRPDFVLSYDFDMDGQMDLIYGDDDSFRTAKPHLTYQDKVFTQTYQCTLLTEYSIGFDRLKILDFNFDGHEDFLGMVGSSFRLYYGLGNNTFGPSNYISMGMFPPMIPDFADYDFADYDGDGDYDLFFKFNGSYSSYPDWTRKLALLRNDGNNVFYETFIDSFDIYTNREQYLLDYDQDGDIDVISTMNDTIFWYENTACYSSAVISDTVCGSYLSPSGNYTWYESGIYKDMIPNANGCDSSITITLTVQNSSNTIFVEDCSGYLSPSGNYIWEESGVYFDTISNTLGCDSLLTIDVQILNSRQEIHLESCDPVVSPSEQFVWNEDGVFIDTILNGYNCDSIITFYLDITDIDTAVVRDDSTLNALNDFGQFQWIDCNANKPLIGENKSSFLPIIDGSYAVVISANNCVDTSSCFDVKLHNLALDYILYNQATNKWDVDFNNVFENLHLVVYDILGKQLYENAYEDAQMVSVGLAVPPGTYVFSLKFDGKEEHIKVIKN